MEKIEITRAARKIGSLRKKIWGIQGGAGAGKTISILLFLIDYMHRVPNAKIFIISGELAKMKENVIHDFLKLMKILGHYNERSFKNGSKYTHSNESFVRFIGLDQEDLGKGMRSDICFFNEANKIKSFEAFRQMMQRAKRVILDFNPDVFFWYHKQIKNRRDCDHLVLTYLDNKFCPPNEVEELMLYKERGFDKDGNVIDEYYANKWRVYGLGQVGGVEGRIFYWKKISLKDYQEISAPAYYGVDWGTVDPFAIIEVKYYDGQLYVHQLNYKSENQWRKVLTMAQKQEVDAKDGEGFVTWLFTRLGVPKGARIICDNNRQTKVVALRKRGWTKALEALKPKGSIIDGVDLMKNLTVYYTETSLNIEDEQLNYAMDKDRHGEPLDHPEDTNNHAMDAIRYVVLWLHKKGIIKAA